MPDPGRNVMVVTHSQFRGLLMGVASRLVEQRGVRAHLYLAFERDVAFYRTHQSRVFSSINVANVLYSTCSGPAIEDDSIVETAREWERRLGVTMNALAVSDRHLGRGYALGGFRHPRSSLSENTGYRQMLAALTAEIAYWNAEILEKRPALIVNAGKILNVLARAHGIPVRNLCGARYLNYYYWGINEFAETPAIERAYTSLEPAEALPFAAPYQSYATHRDRFLSKHTVVNCLRQSALYAARHVYWRLRGYEKARGYRLRSMLGYVWAQRAAARDMTNAARPRLDDLGDTPFVFFPLATEPETALQTLSPEYFYQLSAIAALSRDLPAGVLLVVKEHHVAVGRRPADFYAQIEEFKNVRILDMTERGFDVVARAAAVATISGTAGFEAAVMGRPVIAFGRHNLYNFLPHVMVVTDERELPELLRRALDGRFDRQAAETAGQRFLQAVVRASFDGRGFSPWKPDAADPQTIDDAHRALIESLPTTAPAPAAADLAAVSAE